MYKYIAAVRMSNDQKITSGMSPKKYRAKSEKFPTTSSPLYSCFTAAGLGTTSVCAGAELREDTGRTSIGFRNAAVMSLYIISREVK